MCSRTLQNYSILKPGDLRMKNNIVLALLVYDRLGPADTRSTTMAILKHFAFIIFLLFSHTTVYNVYLTFPI